MMKMRIKKIKLKGIEGLLRKNEELKVPEKIEV